MKNLFIILAVILLSSISYADTTNHKQYKIDVSICPVKKTKTEIQIFKKECVHNTAFYYVDRGCTPTGKVQCCDGTISRSCRC